MRKIAKIAALLAAFSLALGFVSCSNSSDGPGYVPGPTGAYTVTVTGGTATPSSAAAGTTITIKADNPSEGKAFYKWTTTTAGVKFASATSAETTFVMPASNVAVTANFNSTLDLSTVTADTVIKDNTIVTGTLGANVKISIADGATVTLKDVTINGTEGESYKWAGLTCAGDATITLEGTNTVKGWRYYPGVFVPKGKTLTIKGSGSLAANSLLGAGIGGCNALDSPYNIPKEEGSCGTIVIEGGTITATGGRAAGIGCGLNSDCDGVTIKGGTVTAISGVWAAGIGSSKGGSCGPISITGGTVTATSVEDGAGVGTGRGSDSKCGAITVTDGVTKFTATKGHDTADSVGLGRDCGDCGTVTIGGTVYLEDSVYQNDGATVLGQSPFIYWPHGIDLSTVTEDTVIPDGFTVSGTLGQSVKISIAANATVTLDGVSINADGSLAGADHAGIVCEGDATIVLADGSTNDVKGFMDGPSGVHVLPGFTLTINGSTGVLNASTKGGGAGIGSGYNGGQRAGGNIVINGGVINAYGGNLGAGIGSGGRSSIGNITINGGTINAVGGSNSAGIGCGNTNKDGATLAGISQCGAITIKNTVTMVKATKGSGAAHSIGKGNNSGDAVCGTVKIGGAEGYISTSPYTYQP